MIDVPSKWVLDEAKKIPDQQKFFNFLCAYYTIPTVQIVVDPKNVVSGAQANYVSRTFPLAKAVIYLRIISTDPWVVRHEFCHHLQYSLSGGRQDYNEDFASAWATEFTKRLNEA